MLISEFKLHYIVYREKDGKHKRLVKYFSLLYNLRLREVGIH